MFPVAMVQADCLPAAPLQAARVAAITDGDTLRLEDGRRVRLVAVNSPELARQGRPAEVLADAARQYVRQQIQPGQTVYLHAQGQDRYQRLLASVFLQAEGKHLGEALLRAGLAWHIVVPPAQLAYVDCLAAAEAVARQQGVGVWSRVALSPAQLNKAEQGFRRVTFTLAKIAESKPALWLETDGNLVLRLDRRDLVNFADPPQQWLGHRFEVRGWLMHRRPPRPGLAEFKMDLRHPQNIKCLDCN